MPWHSRPATHPRVSALPLGARWCPLLSLSFSTFLSVSLALSQCLRLVARGSANPLQHRYSITQHSPSSQPPASVFGMARNKLSCSSLFFSLLLSFFFHLSLLLMANTSQTRLFFKSASAKMVLCLLFVILVFAFSLPPPTPRLILFSALAKKWNGRAMKTGNDL